MAEQNEYKIVVLGGGGVGKSALTIRLVTDNFLDEYDPTIEDSYRKQVQIDNEPALLDILDTAGQEEFSSMQDQWMREGKGFLLVYSQASEQSFNELEILYQKILRAKDAAPGKVPVVVAANKHDLDADLKVVKTSEARSQLAKAFFGEDTDSAKDKVNLLETSAKTKYHNEECFYEVVREIRRLERQDDNKTDGQKKGGIRCNIL